MALAARIQGRSYNVYCLMGDGETQEGQVWEAAMTSSSYCLGNLVAIIDYNRLKATDETASAKRMEPMAERWEAFGWRVREIDGHDMAQICDALDWADANEDTPSLIIAHTIKGKGIPFMEGQAQYHNAPLDEGQMAQAVAGLEARLQSMREEAR